MNSNMAVNGIVVCFLLYFLNTAVALDRSLGGFKEVYAWKQMTYDINGIEVLHDRFAGIDETERVKRQTDAVYFQNDDDEEIKRPAPSRPNEDESGRFFIQYNNLPMGAEKVGNRLFIALPRRNYGIPATLNYIDLNTQTERSPSLRPYPDVFRSRSLISVYRTRADTCNRLWMVDTGLLELSVISNRRQLQPPGIVIFDLNTNQQILRYTLKDSDVPSATTPAGLASITVDITGNCDDAYAYIPDLSTYGIIVYSLKDNDSWRLQHNYFSYNPVAGNIRVAGEYFQWSDGIFSITLSPPTPDTCRKAYFHPLVSTEEFAVSTCVLKNKTASTNRYFFDKFSYLGDRGQNSQCTMHDYHERTGVIFFADIGRDGISCWNTVKPLSANTVSVLAQHDDLLSYPADLHVTGDEVWVITNRLPRFGYSRLNTDEYNFFIYKGHVQRLIYGTPCAVY
ncbi:L-dopachrome tautomerase yellow-f2-like isoform X1 [Colias croceus]|uniref:L-dopachrome tautomerase yellow-f2-like isoform X1 n=1 Tax=Colias crocea TaxID=72248 RepID=UPI001E27EC63|nr:L-dopachrome tautomerase yellow-f2-like isoform X1 [Colias croceus]